jgi:cytochrome c
VRRHALIALAAVAAKAALIVMVFMAQATAQTPPQAESPQLKRGRLLYLQCRACHELKPTGAALVGPHLGGIVGRKAAGVVGFAYSPALAAQSFNWDRERLDRWLASPGKMLPGNTMAFAGLESAEDRAALIAYLEVATASP